MFFIDEINRKTHNVNADSYESPKDEKGKVVKDETAFYNRVFDVLNERQIPYMGITYNNKTQKHYVYCTSGLKKALHNAHQVCFEYFIKKHTFQTK